MKFLQPSELGTYAEEILSFYVPLALSLPQLRDNPEFIKTTVKAVNSAGKQDIVTAADTYMQQQIKEHIKRLHPDWQFWGEEGQDNISTYDLSKKYLLITDPIEGTINFKNRNDDNWGSVIALVDIQAKLPVIGIIAHPSKKFFYVGIKGNGTHTLQYDQSNELIDVSPMKKNPEFDQFTYNNSPHFSPELTKRVERFLSLEEVKQNKNFVDPESGALEAVRYKGTLYFKTSNEIAAVFVILGELGGKVTDFDGNLWSLGINTLIAARNEDDHEFLKRLMDTVKK